MKDLLVVVADKSMEFILRGGLARSEALGIRSITVEFLQHPGRDGGVRTSGVDLLTVERRSFRNGILILDHEGSGAGAMTSLELEAELDRSLTNGWGENAKSIVLDPEIDVWMWGSDNVLQEIFEWRGQPSIRDWLSEQNFEIEANGKPTRPKEAMEAICRQQRFPRSAALYEQIAGRISLQRCRDLAFLRMLNQLKLWFPPTHE